MFKTLLFLFPSKLGLFLILGKVHEYAHMKRLSLINKQTNKQTSAVDVERYFIALK